MTAILIDALYVFGIASEYHTASFPGSLFNGSTGRTETLGTRLTVLYSLTLLLFSLLHLLFVGYNNVTPLLCHKTEIFWLVADRITECMSFDYNYLFCQEYKPCHDKRDSAVHAIEYQILKGSTSLI